MTLPFGLLVAGCVAPQLNYANGSFNGAAQNALANARSQKPDEVTPASAVKLPPVTLADGKVAARAVAYVNNTPIFESEWQEALAQRAREYAELAEPQRTQRRKLVEQQELDRLIEREVIMDAAMAHLKKMKSSVMDEMKKEATKEYERRLRDLKTTYGIQTDEQLKDAFATQGMSTESFRRQIERGFITTEYMRNLIFPKVQTIPLSEIREYYDQHAQEFQEQERVKWQALFVDAGKFPDRAAARRYADQVIVRLRAGDDFAMLAKRLRESGVNILLNDVGPGEKRGEIQPAEVEPTLFQLRQNEIGGPVEMPGGFYVVRVTERTYAGRKSLTVEMQSEIRKRLQNLHAEREYRRMLEDMKTRAVIQKLIQP